jgi:hypothetical protein
MPQTVPCHGGAGGSFSGAFTLAGSFSAAFTLADVRSPTCFTSCLLALLAHAQEPVGGSHTKRQVLYSKKSQGTVSSSNSTRVQSALLGSSALLLHPAADDLHVAPQRGGARPYVRLHQIHHGAQRHCASERLSPAAQALSAEACAEDQRAGLLAPAVRTKLVHIWGKPSA